MKKKIGFITLFIIASLLSVGGLTACGEDDAKVASENVSKACDNFECNRRIVAFNGITDKYLMVIEGNCSIEDEGVQLEVICKVTDNESGNDEFKKSFLGLSDNVSYFVEQGEPIEASVNHYRVTFKPQSILPDPDFRGSAEDTPLSPDNQQ